MAFYRTKVLPRLQDKAMNRPAVRDVRSRVCARIGGEVVELGFGTGLNAPHYPEGVDRVLAVEPSALCMRIAQPRIEAAGPDVELAGLDGQRLDVPTDSVDAVLSTWTLCTIPDLNAALGEVRRVLKPGGTLVFVEHGHAPDEKVARWQRRLEPVSKRVFGGCHLTRDIAGEVEAAGLAIDELDTYYADHDPKPFAFTYEGRAIAR